MCLLTPIFIRLATLVAGLSRVAAAAQLGVVVGPAASAIFQTTFRKFGVKNERCLQAVFAANAVFTLSSLIVMTILHRSSNVSQNDSALTPSEKPLQSPQKVPWKYTQKTLRLITIIIGSTAILSNSIYGLFAPKYLGFGQTQLSATYSTAAGLMVLSQIIFPRILEKLGSHLTLTFGILSSAIGKKILSESEKRISTSNSNSSLLVSTQVYQV